MTEREPTGRATGGPAGGPTGGGAGAQPPGPTRAQAAGPTGAHPPRPTWAQPPGPEGDDGLDALFAAARARSPRPSAALMGRVLADAAAAAPQHRARWLRRPPTRSLPARLLPLRRLPVWRLPVWRLPVWPVPAGLAAALVAGLWVGAMPPAPLLALEEALLGPSVLLDAADPADWPADWLDLE